MVGGLADWFAVTALFRRPLGLPIPHTALIPTRKDALGASLGTFVGRQLPRPLRWSGGGSTRSIVLGRLGAWLARPESARRVAAEAATAFHGALEVLRDDDVRAIVEEVASRRLRDAQVAPVLGRLLGQVVADGSHHALVDVTAKRTAAWLHEQPCDRHRARSRTRPPRGRRPSSTVRSRSASTASSCGSPSRSS